MSPTTLGDHLDYYPMSCIALEDTNRKLHPQTPLNPFPINLRSLNLICYVLSVININKIISWHFSCTRNNQDLNFPSSQHISPVSENYYDNSCRLTWLAGFVFQPAQRTTSTVNMRKEKHKISRKLFESKFHWSVPATAGRIYFHDYQ